MAHNKIQTISTDTLDILVNSLEKNTSIVKFAYDGFRFQQHRDKCAKYLKRNNEIARQARKLAKLAEQSENESENDASVPEKGFD